MSGPEAHDSARDRLVIAFEDLSVIEDIRKMAQGHGADIEVSEALGLIYWSNWNCAVRRSVERLPGVLQVEQETHAAISLVPDDPYFGTYQWGVERIDAPDAWDYTLGNSSVVIAVLDTGIDYTHDDLTANMWRNGDGYYGYDFWNDDNDPMDDNIHGFEGGVWMPNTYTYHGTHVAGIAGAVTDNSLGVAGIAQVELMAVKVMNESGEGTDVTVAEGIRYAVDNGADIVTMSLGVDSSTWALTQAVNYASQHEVVLIAAAGNAGVSPIAYPAAYPSVIAVGASDQTDNRASFSNYGSALDILAPGSRIWSTKRGDSYQELSGTSTATPFVAGVAGLMISVNPGLTPEEIGEAINTTAENLGSPGWDITTGWGIVNAHSAVVSVSGPAATIIDYPETAEPTSSVTIRWVVSGAGELPIDSTYVRWGYSLDDMTNISGLSSGNTTPHTYTVDDVIAPPAENMILFIQAIAIIDGTEYSSRVVEIETMFSVVDPFTQLFENIRRFIIEDLGPLNFAILIIAIITVAIVLAVVRAKRRAERAKLASAFNAYQIQSQAPPSPAAGMDAAAIPPPPPSAPSLPSIFVDISGDAIVPDMIEVFEGTRVIWRNRDWAPPPGISVISGHVDATGAHPDGIFASGAMIAPGEYWSCIFNASGEYPYFISNLNLNGRIVVLPRS